jgi:hypothetical protein
VDDNIRVEYVVGGLDQVVPLSSAAWSQNSKIHTVIDANHRSIVKPKSEEEISFKILKNFVLGNKVAPALPRSPWQQGQSPADPLFDVYTSASEKFYVVRQADKALDAAALASNVWVSGPSGVGKTAALMRLIKQKGGRIAHLMLSGHGNVGPSNLVAAMLTALYEQLGRNETVVTVGNAQHFLEHSRALHELANDSNLYVLVEEIPIKAEEFEEFLTYIYHIVVTPGVQSRIHWLFSSIHTPPIVLPKGQAHLLERMQFLRFDLWTTAELRRLVNRIAGSKTVRLTRDEKHMLITSACGSPRVAKMVLRRHRYATGATIAFGELIASVKRDLGQ